MCHTIHTNHTIKLSYITYKYDMILSYIPYKYEIGQTAAEGMPRFQRTVSGPRTGRGPRQESRDKPKAKAPHLPTEGRYGPRDIWATSPGRCVQCSTSPKGGICLSRGREPAEADSL